jgi:hypothetical protein
MLAAIAGARLEGSAKLDIARLAAMMPETLHVRPGTQITGGELTASLSTRSEASDRVTASHLSVTSLTATHDGRPIAWNDPVNFSLELRDGPSGPVLKNLECQSSFLTAQAAGNAERGTARLDADVRKLMSELRPFFALDRVELAGTLAAKLDWNRDAEGVFGAAGEARLADFQYLTPSSTPWREPSLLVKCSATGAMENGELKRLFTANVQLDGAADQLRAQLVKPVFELSSDPVWPVSFRAKGRLASWLSRLRPLVDVGVQADGNCDLTAAVTIERDAVDLSDAKLIIETLRVGGKGLSIEEPSVQIQAAGKYRITDRRLDVAKATLVSTAVSAGSEGLTISLPRDAAPSAQGAVAVRADVGRLSRWFASAQGSRFAWSGAVLGRVDLHRQESTTSVNLETDITDAQLVGASNDPKKPDATVVWRDPKIRLVAALAHDANADRLRLTKIELASSSIRATAAGELTKVSTQPQIDLAGQLDYDWQTASGLLQPLVGDHVRLAGRGPEAFSVRGPLGEWRNHLVAEATVGWSAAQAYGMAIGPAKLHSVLQAGRMKIDPLNVPIDQGRLTIAPELDFTGSRPTLLIGKGPVLSEVPVTPELCRAALKYVHPFVVGVASVDGKISLATEGAAIPLGSPSEIEAAGRLTIHSVRIGPGALLNHLLPALLQPAPRSVPLLPDVEFWVKNGRVYHRGVGVMIGEVPVRTTGSVGFDDSIELVAQVPLALMPSRVKLTNAVRSQTLRIPVRGTLAAPVLDLKELQRLLRDTAAGALRDELLDRLLKPREPKPQK